MVIHIFTTSKVKKNSKSKIVYDAEIIDQKKYRMFDRNENEQRTLGTMKIKLNRIVRIFIQKTLFIFSEMITTNEEP